MKLSSGKNTVRMVPKDWEVGVGKRTRGEKNKAFLTQERMRLIIDKRWNLHRKRETRRNWDTAV